MNECVNNNFGFYSFLGKIKKKGKRKCLKICTVLFVFFSSIVIFFYFTCICTINTNVMFAIVIVNVAEI